MFNNVTYGIQMFIIMEWFIEQKAGNILYRGLQVRLATVAKSDTILKLYK